MQIILAIELGAASVLWIWGALSGRLASMVAAVVSPTWVGAPSSSSGTSGALGSSAAAAASAAAQSISPEAKTVPGIASSTVGFSTGVIAWIKEHL